MLTPSESTTSVCTDASRSDNYITQDEIFHVWQTEMENLNSGYVNKLHIYSEFRVSPNKVCLNKEFHLLNEGVCIL